MTDGSGGLAELSPPGKDELFELIVESARDFAIFTTNPDGVATSWNPGAERLFGFTAEQMIGHDADVIFTPEDRRREAPELERVRAREHGRAMDERWHMRADGSSFWASGLLMPLEKGDGFVKITQDRTERHRADEQLRQNEERFRILALSIPQLVFRTRGNGSRTWGSPQWIDFTGLSLEESLGEGWLDAIHPDDRQGTMEAWKDAIVAGEYYFEHRIRRAADGEYRWHQTRARPIESADPTITDWVGTMTDIDDLRGAQARQQVLMAELQHRTRNLLAVVQSIASTTIRSSSSLESFKQEYESRLRALSRVQSLLARSEDDVDLRSLVQLELAAHGDGLLETDKINIAGPPVSLPPNSAQALALALHELATNAVKYGALAQPEAKLEVWWAFSGPQGGAPAVELHWQESGVAMPQEPRRKGYGSELIERALPYQLSAGTALEFGPDGVRCVIRTPINKAEQ